MKIVRTYKHAETGERYTVEIVFDLELIAFDMARRAVWNRTKKAGAFEGGIKAKVLTDEKEVKP